jgi:hypothetical protein
MSVQEPAIVAADSPRRLAQVRELFVEYRDALGIDLGF